MKPIKKPVRFLLCIVGVVVVLVLALPLWVGPVVKTVANLVVPRKTGTAFNLGAFALNPYTGNLAVGDVQLFNPPGFGQKMAATLGSLDVAVDMASLAGDPIVIRDIVLKDVFVSYVSNARGKNNFAIIKQNATGGDEAKTKVKVKGEGEQRSDKPSSFQTPQTSQTSKKVIIGRLRIENVVVQFGPLSLPVPNIDLADIGRKSNGVTMAEAWDQIYAQMLKDFDALGVNLDSLVTNFGNASLNQVSETVDDVKDIRGVVDAFKGGAGEVGGAAGKTVDAVGGATKKAADAVGEQADKAVNALRGLFK